MTTRPVADGVLDQNTLAPKADPARTAGGAGRPRLGMRARSRIQMVIIYLTLSVWVAASLAPVVWAILQSIKLPPDIFAVPPRWLFHATLENFGTLFSQTGSTFIGYLLISLVVTVGTVVITLVASLPAAYTLTFLPVRRSFWPVVLLLAAMLPPIVLLVPLFLFWENLGMIDNPMALILTYSAVNVPFTVWLLRGFMLQVPAALIDAGRIDGAGDVRLLGSVVVPVVRAGIASASVFLVIFAWNELLFASILTTSRRTAPAGIVATLITDRAMDWGTLYAAGTLVIVPIIVFTFAVRKHFVRGFTFGAVKG
jgi:multiple sugar transport system permease protein